MSGSERPLVLARVVDHLIGLATTRPLRVAVDGVTAAGKSTLASELTRLVRERGRPAVHLSADDFHQPRAYRYRQGRDSPLGYYTDAYDFDALRRLTLDPLGPGGDRRYRARHWDLERDQPADEPAELAADDLIVVVDGSFLQRPEIAGGWDQVIYLDTSFAAARAQGARRDADHFGGLAAAVAAYERRYHAACQLYLDEIHPADRADVLLHGDDPSRLRLGRIGAT